MLSSFKRKKAQQHLARLPKISQPLDDIKVLSSPRDYRSALLDLISHAEHRIYLIALYLEHDDAGIDILSAIYQAKMRRPELDVAIFVDWHRAQRGRIGDVAENTNADWYCKMAEQYPNVHVPIYGVPVNTREALGVLHLKGSIVDNTVAYTGASVNDVYLHQHDKYRYDRYQFITNPALTDSMVDYVKQNLLPAAAVHNLDCHNRPSKPEIKNDIKKFRQTLRVQEYKFVDSATDEQLAVTPLVGLGRHSPLNKAIDRLMNSTEHKLTLCTPYFNLPAPLVKNIISLLRQGKQVEIIVGDKTANDFYIPEDQPFKIIGALPYLYEINLRRFVTRLQRYVDKGLLTIRLWKDDDNTYHLKGIWVDDNWQLITGNNLNPRAWHLDLENAILIHDPQGELKEARQHELECIRTHTFVINHYQQLQSIQFYPVKIRKLIRRLKRIRIDKLISRIL
ncbi:MAG: CDP-diacylglycerol--serine O-phosphatidyltransferase [Enterobacteriaceae bacterium]|jgi:CDP-diacylglycerol--serine O-phosphatidyltransferase|nr:CDP-diacylglycerol--serine O-phosphatidyltransferase [Enterobacteriaceae bacterium]